jgi:hypothetical protein
MAVAKGLYDDMGTSLFPREYDNFTFKVSGTHPDGGPMRFRGRRRMRRPKRSVQRFKAERTVAVASHLRCSAPGAVLQIWALRAGAVGAGGGRRAREREAIARHHMVACDLSIDALHAAVACRSRGCLAMPCTR